jgi:hypothetical protein
MVVVVLGGRGLVLVDEITAERTFPQPKIPAKTTLELRNPASSRPDRNLSTYRSRTTLLDSLTSTPMGLIIPAD